MFQYHLVFSGSCCLPVIYAWLSSISKGLEIKDFCTPKKQNWAFDHKYSHSQQGETKRERSHSCRGKRFLKLQKAVEEIEIKPPDSGF